MDIHPLHAVGFLQDSHFTQSSPILLDSNLSPSALFPADPLHEHLPHPDDHFLDKIISSSFDDLTDPIPHSSSCSSTSASPRVPPPQFTHSLIDQIDLMLTPPCPPPPKPHSHHRTSAPQKRPIQKERRSRAPARPWTHAEHHRFEQSLELFGRDWDQCAAYIGTRRPQLVRSHAQKHLIKLWKLGKPLPKKVAESGTGYTLSGKPLLADSASARSYLTKIPCPNYCHPAK